MKVDYGKRRVNLGNAVASLTANGAPAAVPVPAMDLPVLLLTVAVLYAFAAIRIRKH